MNRCHAILRSQAGFSLIELIIVIVILSIVSIGFGKFLSKSVEGYRWTVDQADDAGNARLALDHLIREIGQIPDPGSSVTIMQPHVFEFDGNDGATRHIEWSGVPGDTLWYGLGDADYAMVTPLDSLGFGYYDEFGTATTDAGLLRRVGITLIAGDATHRVRFRTGIHVRNHS